MLKVAPRLPKHATWSLGIASGFGRLRLSAAVVLVWRRIMMGPSQLNRRVPMEARSLAVPPLRPQFELPLFLRLETRAPAVMFAMVCMLILVVSLGRDEASLTVSGPSGERSA